MGKKRIEKLLIHQEFCDHANSAHQRQDQGNQRKPEVVEDHAGNHADPDDDDPAHKRFGMQIEFLELHAVRILAQLVGHMLLRLALRRAAGFTAADLLADILNFLHAVVDAFLDLRLVILNAF